VKLAVRREGSAPPLVCHPGGPGFSAASLTDLGGLADSFELIVLDPRGTGATAHAQTYRQEEYVADLEELRADIGLEQFHLLGHSHCGFVAIAYAAAHPGRVRKLVLAATAPHEFVRLAMIESCASSSHDPKAPA
jgi:pimeloyl-ACP methyl ester carboxylesterase